MNTQRPTHGASPPTRFTVGLVTLYIFIVFVVAGGLLNESPADPVMPRHISTYGAQQYQDFADIGDRYEYDSEADCGD